MRFEQSTITGFGSYYLVDDQGYYRCKTCDVLLGQKRQRYCDMHQPRHSLRRLRVLI